MHNRHLKFAYHSVLYRDAFGVQVARFVLGHGSWSGGGLHSGVINGMRSGHVTLLAEAGASPTL